MISPSLFIFFPFTSLDEASKLDQGTANTTVAFRAVSENETRYFRVDMATSVKCHTIYGSMASKMGNCCVVLRALVNRDQTRMGFRGNGSSPFSSAAALSVQQIVTTIMLTSASFPHCLESGITDDLVEMRDVV
ncbi:hypothetical protein V6N13_008108 [Hibiscus sabdariffa]